MSSEQIAGWCWAAFITIGVVADIILNAINPRLTLSSRIWTLEGINKYTGGHGWSLFRYGLLVVLLWLVGHLVFKIFRGI